jgi:tetratricopeptide (TPR) repeat protein
MNAIPPKPAAHSVGLFVRNAWTLLVFQLAAAAVALAVTVWAAFQVRPLLEERDRLASSIAKLSEDEKQAREAVSVLESRAADLRRDLQGARDATPVLTDAITAFHRKEYAGAIVKYDEASKLNPGDPYIYNLKSYSQFKAGDFNGAIDTLTWALQMNPAYEWGYFDLARYYCAAGKPQTALAAIKAALGLRGEGIRSGIEFFLSKDGEFRRLCADISGDLRKLAEAPPTGRR